VSFCFLASYLLLWALITTFVDPTQLVPSLDLLLGNLDKDLEYCLRHVSFVLHLFYFVVLIVIEYFTLQALAQS
jgi:hypothetical protein